MKLLSQRWTSCPARFRRALPQGGLRRLFKERDSRRTSSEERRDPRRWNPRDFDLTACWTAAAPHTGGNKRPFDCSVPWEWEWGGRRGESSLSKQVGKGAFQPALPDAEPLSVSARNPTLFPCGLGGRRPCPSKAGPPSVSKGLAPYWGEPRRARRTLGAAASPPPKHFPREALIFATFPGRKRPATLPNTPGIGALQAEPGRASSGVSATKPSGTDSVVKAPGLPAGGTACRPRRRLCAASWRSLTRPRCI